MKNSRELIIEFENISSDLKFLLDKIVDLILDSYSGTPTETSALKYLNQIKKLSEEIEDKTSKEKLVQTNEGLNTLDEVEKLIKKRNKLLKQLGITV